MTGIAAEAVQQTMIVRVEEVTRTYGSGATAVHALRGMELVKPPGVAESLDWARALRELDRDVLDAQTAAATLGAVVKYHEDLERVARLGLDRLLAG